MNDQFNYKEIAEEQCNRRYHTEMWKDERVQVLKERAALAEENERLRAENERLWMLLTMCAELVREEANTHDDDCDCDYCEAVAALEEKP